MRTRCLLTCVVALLPGLLSAGEQVLNGHTFTLPEGFVIEVAAKAPLVDRPITADFDEQGRLYVTDSSGSNDPVVKQLENPTHRIRRLEDVNGDGVYDKSTLFADKMMFPEGTLWHDGSLYVAAPPQIWKLTDTDDDGVSDDREVWFDGKTLTGCANDLHGPYLGPDGYIYWCKGAFAEQTYEQPGKPPLVTKASHIFRRKADGTGPIENMMTGGMDNPVDLVFTPTGDIIFSTTFLQNPGGGLRDGLIHAVHGGVYGKEHNVTDFHPRTGELMPPLVQMGAAAPCGLTRYESQVFGKEFQDNLFACQFNMYKVSRHELKPSGATYVSTDTDFVLSTNLDFHPTDVLEDADGSLVIFDTGGWYKLCCPTSQLEKADVLGAVYRVRRVDAVPLDDPRGMELNWKNPRPAELTTRLDDPRPAVQRRAIRDLAKQAENPVLAAVKSQLSSQSEQARRNAVWTLTRINSANSREQIRQACGDPASSVRLAALHAVSLNRDGESMMDALKMLGPDAATARIAAEILGRIGHNIAVGQLLSRAGDPRVDRVLEHSIIYALIEIADPKLTSQGLTSPNHRTQRAAMIALDQMPAGGLTPDQVVPLLTSADITLRDTALWLVNRHTEWGDALGTYLEQQLARHEWTEAEQQNVELLLARFAATPSVQALLAKQVAPPWDDTVQSTRAAICLSAMRQSGLAKMPESWLQSISILLGPETPSPIKLKAQAITVVRSVPLPENGTDDLAKGLRDFALRCHADDVMRVEAVAALPPGPSVADPEMFGIALDRLRVEVSVAERSAAVEALLKAQLSVEQLGLLADMIATVGPLELNRLLAVFEPSSELAVGEKLIAALKKSPVLTSLRVDALKLRIAKFPPPVQEQAEALYAAINVEAAKQKERLDELVALAGQGDIRRGQVVFGNQKSACTACHAMGYKGGNVGPDLSRIGKIRTERDLLESILFPSVSLVRSYEPILIVTHSGKTHNGLIRRESADEVVLTTGAHQEVRISRSDIEEIRPSTVSVMPAGLETQLTREQIIDLVTFLKSRQ